MSDLDALTNEIEQGFMQRGGWEACRHLLGKLAQATGEAFEPRDHFDLTPQQYHAGLDKLWAALGLTEVQDEDVFTLAARAITERKELQAKYDEICGELYGQGFEVAGWHLNGALQSLDSWFEDNDWLEWWSDTTTQGG